MALQHGASDARYAGELHADPRSADQSDGCPSPSPRITVITPTYNVAAYVGEAVDSVLCQTFRDFEYLVVDDGSTDRTVDEVRQRMAADQRLRLIEASHGGSANARNLALRQARGEFIAFLDGDDRWRRNFLEQQLALLESVGSDVAAVFARSRVISESGRVYAFRWQRAGRYDFDDMLIQACPPRCGSSLLIRKASFDVAGEFNEQKTAAVDHDMWLRIQRDSGMPYFWGNSAYLLDIRVRPGALSRDHRRIFEERDIVARDYSPALQRYPAAMAYVRAAVFAFRAGQEDFALRWARLARQAGFRSLAADTYGWRLLGWSALPSSGRRLLRWCNSQLRALLGRIARAPGGLQR